MKPYEKPRLMALSLSGNNQLCGSCSEEGCQNLLYKDPTSGIALALDFLVGNDDGVLTQAEASKAFAPSESCEVPVDSYCKFNPGDEMRVAWS